MANPSSNSLFIATGVLFVVALLFLAYPYLTLTAAALCGILHISYNHSSVFSHYYTYFTSVLWPTLSGNDRQPPYSPNLLTGVDLPSPIPHVPSGLEIAKNRRSPVDEIVSSTPRSTPTSSHGTSASSAMPLPPRVSPEMVVTDSRQLNFGRINTPKTSRNQAPDFFQNSVDPSSIHKLRNRGNGGKMIQTTAGPLLSSVRHNPTFDAGLFVNVNSPGFTDRLVRCANDNSGLGWGHNVPATQQDRYGSVGLFPIVHLNTSPPPSLTARNSQKLPNSSVRVKIAPPVSPDQRQHFNRNNMQMRSYNAIRKNELAKSVLESLQEASRKRIYSQCQEVMEDDSGKKRQRKGETALPNPNCDMYQYRHIRAPSVPSSLSAAGTNDIQSHGKRLHDDPSRANEAKRLRQLAKPQSSNNEISSSLSSSKTLLQRLSGNKRKADCYDLGEDGKGKQFKESSSAVSSPSTSRWLHSQTCEAGESAARTQEVLRNRRKTPETSSTSSKKVVLKSVNVTESAGVSSIQNTTPSIERIEVPSEKVADKGEIDLSSKLFRKDVVARSHPKVNQSEKKGSSWSQVPPDADERCLSEQGSSSELDRPERFQSLLSRMSGQDIRNMKQSEHTSKPSENQTNISISNLLPDPVDKDSVKVPPAVITSPSAVVAASPSAVSSVSSFSTMTSAGPKLITKEPTSAAPPASAPEPAIIATSPSSPLTSLISEKTQVENPTPSMPSALTPTAVKFNLSGKEEKTASPSSSKPMFNFTPSNSQASLRPVNSQTALPLAPPKSSSSSFSQPMFQFTVSPLKSVQGVENLKSASVAESATSQKISVSLPTVSSNQTSTNISAPDSLKSASPFQSGFSFLPSSSQANVTSLADNSKSIITTVDKTVSFMLPGQKPQFTSGSSSFAPLQQPQLNGPSVSSAPVTSSSIFSTSNLNQASEMSQTSGADKKTFGGFAFNGASGSIFGGQPSSTNTAPTAASFSFTPASALPVMNASPKNGSESKSVSGSGSITFGTVSSCATQPTSAMTFNFSAPASVNSVTETPAKTTFQLSNNSSITNSTSTGFNPTGQGLFNGFSSTQNSTSVVASFGAPKQNQQLQLPSQPQQQQQQPNQHPPNQLLHNQQQVQSPGGFSFGSPVSSPPSAAVSFGPVASTTGLVFGEGSSQPSAFGNSITSGFPLQTAIPSFKSSPFASPAASSGLSFGSSQQSNVSSNLFGGQTASNNPPAFPLLSTFSGNSAPTATSTFGAAAVPTFGASVTGESTFGAGSTTASASTVTSAFTFGASSNEKQQAPAFNFGANSTTSFNFGSNDQQQQNTTNALFQFGQPASSNAVPSFQFGSPSAQPGVFSFGASSPSFGTATNPVQLGSFTIGSGGFSMGTGPTTPQRTTRVLPTRRRRI